MRDLDLLPKAHLHLHFTGSMSIPTLVGLAERQGVELPERLVDDIAGEVPVNLRGWFRFQRSYDAARAVVKGEDALRTVVRRAAEEDAAEGSRRLELQVDPSSYGPSVGGEEPALEIILDEARRATQELGVQVAVIVAASRTHHPLDGRSLARLAARHAGDGPGQVVAFGLSNDETVGVTADWAPAFRIAAKAGLAGVPHGGELLGADHVRSIIDELAPTRIGHGVRAVEDPEVLRMVVQRGIALEVNPASNVKLGVYEQQSMVPLRRLVEAGVTVALGADDPLIFLSRLTDQYRFAREVHGFDDAELAELARASIRASLASEADKLTWLREVDQWLAAPAGPDPAG